MNILISGGSKGLGLFLVSNLLKQGHSVATFARNRTPDIDELESKYPSSQFLFNTIDVQDYTTLKQFVTDVKNNFGSINCLVNNAAVGQDHLLSGIKDEEITKIININLTSTIILTKYVVKKMLISNENSQIINISSICADKGYTGLTAYSATKGGLLSFTRSLARELGARKIMVNSISPGFFESEMSAILSEDQLQIIKRRTASGELVTSEQIFKQLDFLLQSNLNITGQNFVVDGGSTI